MNLAIVGIVICALILVVIIGAVVWKLSMSGDGGRSVHKAMLKATGGTPMTSQ